MITIKNISPMDNVIFMQMKDGDLLICEAWAEIKGDTAELMDIKEYEQSLSFDMGKAILNAIELKNIKNVICNNKSLHSTLKKLRFLESNSAYLLSLNGYFMSICKDL